MTENLITEDLNQDIFHLSMSAKDSLLGFDVVSETLRHIYSSSKLKRKLARILSIFYRFPTYIIFLSFLIGFAIICVPFILIYCSLIKNILIPFLIICSITIFIIFLLMIIRIIDDIKSKSSMVTKWERKNLLKNFGSLITMTILLIASCFAYSFYKNIKIKQENENIIIDYNNNKLSKEINLDFLFKYILNLICLSPSKINKNNKNNKIRYNFKITDEEIILHNNMIKFLIPLLVLCVIKIIKIIFINVKFMIQQVLFYIGSLSFCVMLIINNFYSSFESTFNIIEICSIIFIYIGLLSWTLHYMFKFFSRPKDKSFGIRKYCFFNLLIIVFNDIVNCVGITLIFVSIFLYFLASKEKETFNNLIESFKLFKIGFFIFIVANAYYYGHYILAMIFRPIILQYCPAELRNSNYIKVKKNLTSFLTKRRRGLKMKDILPKD